MTWEVIAIRQQQDLRCPAMRPGFALSEVECTRPLVSLSEDKKAQGQLPGNTAWQIQILCGFARGGVQVIESNPATFTQCGKAHSPTIAGP